MLLDSADSCQGKLHIFVRACASVLKPERLGLDPVHQNNAHPGERVIVEFAGGYANNTAPVKFLLVQGYALFNKSKLTIISFP
jgi:hypothetical protein